MQILQVLTVLLMLLIMKIEGFNYRYDKKTKCLNPPRTARKVENHIKGCQEEVQTILLQEALKLLKNEVADNLPHNEYLIDYFKAPEGAVISQKDLWLPEVGMMETPKPELTAPKINAQSSDYSSMTNKNTTHKRMARILQSISRINDLSNSDIYHATLVPSEDKRIAGCLLHCVYHRNDVLDKMGWPTLDGLVDFYSEGVNERGFFMATLRAVNLCLHVTTQKYQVDHDKFSQNGENCDMSFDIFDCISDQITGYCLNHYKV